ncbi:DNA mismatch endonuclease Vsr [Parapusillimonas sp. SGNA-6]|uniref:very short patch repair endonuclease n=1 Tax=Variovorax sp. MHTC-1 TaxID=2495593 RepID=UPI000F87C300|nr:very short patch repair endonuclease [Variovorax sp. MHTC-1]NGM90600.1 DNA mismatch endonuclease Vsr [Parapusillimonas sp. SGNA-6]RST52640.1 DNA mismatch endonuclease Vsr [Variovorax sp. MHTC-1]
MDMIPPEKRSALMSRIRSKNTAPEMLVRRMLHSLGYRYVLHDSRLPGRPDLVFPSRRKAIQIHGCFWHGHDCPRGFKPKSHADFWAAKIEMNRARDARNLAALSDLGWDTLVVWECEMHAAGENAELKRRLIEFLDV